MGRHYSTRDFFRQMPNALLARYFQGRGLFTDLDFTAMKDTRPDELFAAWLELPDGQRKGMDAEFQSIFAMSCEKGFCAIRDEAGWQLAEPQAYTEFVEKLAALASHSERAMVTYLDHNECWQGATRFYHADSLSYWRKRKNMGHQPASVHEDGRQDLAERIRAYFHLTEGRGNNCVVEAFRRDERDYFFAYPEDYSQEGIEWKDGVFARFPHNPAFEVIYVYTQKEGSLDLNYRGARKSIEPLQAIFSSAILKLDELPTDTDDESVYGLSPLLSRNFSFVYEVGSGIQNVTVKKLRLSSRLKKGDRITLEADVSGNSKAVYDLLDNIGVPLSLYYVSQVELGATVMVDADKPLKTVTFRITYPNSCSLKYDELDLKLREMLEASGIEPKEPTEDDGATEAAEPAEA